MDFLFQIFLLFPVSFFTAVVAYVYSDVLTEPEMILAGWYKFLQKKIGAKKWLFKPVIDCDRCVGGQLAMWNYLIFVLLHGQYYFFIHLSYISATIFIIPILRRVYQWAKEGS